MQRRPTLNRLITITIICIVIIVAIHQILVETQLATSYQLLADTRKGTWFMKYYMLLDLSMNMQGVTEITM